MWRLGTVLKRSATNSSYRSQQRSALHAKQLFCVLVLLAVFFAQLPMASEVSASPEPDSWDGFKAISELVGDFSTLGLSAEGQFVEQPSSSEDLRRAVAVSELVERDCSEELNRESIKCFSAFVPEFAHNPQPQRMIELSVAYVDNTGVFTEREALRARHLSALLSGAAIRYAAFGQHFRALLPAFGDTAASSGGEAAAERDTEHIDNTPQSEGEDKNASADADQEGHSEGDTSADQANGALSEGRSDGVNGLAEAGGFTSEFKNLKSLLPAPNSRAVFYLQGGPGVASVRYANRFIGLEFDVVLIDQRGTGESRPALECDAVADLFADELADRVSKEQRNIAFKSCIGQFRDNGLDLEAFNTEAASDDAAIVRSLLGLQHWALWGSSYGTRLAMTIMRDHPDGIDAVVLDSSLPHNVDFFASIPSTVIAVLNRIDSGCTRQQCEKSYGDFKENLAAAVRQLQDSPRTATVTRSNGEEIEVVVDGSALLNMIHTQLYSINGIESLPRQIFELDDGGLEEIVERFVRARDPEVFPFSLSTYFAAWCQEEFPFHDSKALQTAIEVGVETYGEAFIEAFSANEAQSICDLYEVSPVEESETEPVSSAILTVVFAGGFDPITPSLWGRISARYIEDSQYFYFPHSSHGMQSNCAHRLRNTFLLDPESELDSSCIAEIEPLDY